MDPPKIHFVAIYNPSFSHTEDDTQKQLIFYHSYTNNETTADEKVRNIGIVQGLVNFATTFNGDNNTNIVELDNSKIFTIIVEGSYYLSVRVETEMPNEFYVYYLRQSYDFFVLNHGLLAGQPIHVVNEFFLDYWYKLPYLKDNNIGCLMGLYLQGGFKRSQADLPPKYSQFIKEKLLLTEDNYMNMHDVLVYKMDKSSYTNYGFLGCFSETLQPRIISHWLYELDFLGLNAQSLINGNVYKEYLATPVRSHEEVVATEQPSTVDNITKNIMMPFSFAYDAVQEVTSLAGVSSGFNMLTEYIPFGKAKEDTPTTSRNGFVVSPSEGLESHLSVKKLFLEYDGKYDWFDTLVWKWDEYLVFLVYKSGFELIWDDNYLGDLGYCMSQGVPLLKEYKVEKVNKFNYAIFDKHSGEVRTSFPFQHNSASNEFSEGSVSTATRMSSFAFGLLSSRNPIARPLTLRKTFLESLDHEKLAIFHLQLLKIMELPQKEKLIKLNNGLLCYLQNDISRTLIIIKNWFEGDQKLRGVSLIDTMGADVSHWMTQNDL